MKGKDENRTPLMLCTQARGGMRTVVESYERDGVFTRWQFECLWTHREGSALVRVATAVKAYIRLLLKLVGNKISFMHVHAAMRGSFWRKSLFTETARLFGVPAIFHLHGSEMKSFYEGLPVVLQNLVSFLLRRAAVVVVLSQSWRDFIKEISPQANVVVVNNYVRVSPVDLRNDESHGFTVLFLGLIGLRKGVYDLLSAWVEVVKNVPSARLLIGGNGEVDQAKRICKELGVERSVDFVGWVAGADKEELLHRADAFVLPSYNEGLPMSVLEAMACAKPVVTTRVGGIPELIDDNTNGLLVDAGNVAGLADALIRLAQDGSLRSAIGAAAYQRVLSAYSDKSVLPRLDDIYQRLCSGDGGVRAPDIEGARS